jgi:hypothetical protein
MCNHIQFFAPEDEGSMDHADGNTDNDIESHAE